MKTKEVVHTHAKPIEKPKPLGPSEGHAENCAAHLLERPPVPLWDGTPVQRSTRPRSAKAL